jgi:hypothetical protein
MKIFYCTFLGALLSLALTAQKKQPQVKFNSNIQGGILEGQHHNTTGQLQWVNGFRVGSWAAGIGVGVDYYGSKRSLPLFVDVKKYLLSGHKSPFVYASAGHNFSWLRDDQKRFAWSVLNYKEEGGLYYDVGIGYRFPVGRWLDMGFSGGYSYKRQKEVFQLAPCITCFPQPQPSFIPDSYDYQFRRLSLKASLWF